MAQSTIPMNSWQEPLFVLGWQRGACFVHQEGRDCCAKLILSTDVVLWHSQSQAFLRNALLLTTGLPSSPFLTPGGAQAQAPSNQMTFFKLPLGLSGARMG